MVSLRLLFTGAAFALLAEFVTPGDAPLLGLVGYYDLVLAAHSAHGAPGVFGADGKNTG